LCIVCCKVLRQYGDVSDTEPGATATNVEETEEMLDDGTVVKRRVVTTTQQQLTTERVVLEPDDEFDSSRVIDEDDPPLQLPVFDYSDTGLSLLSVCVFVHF